MTTIQDLAKLCHVSIATVSRAFDKKAVIRPETRKRILDAAEATGYTPNPAARSLKLSRTHTVGILIPSISNYFYIDVLKQFQIKLQKQGYSLLVNFLDYGVISERDALESMMRTRPDALVFSPRTRENAEYIRRIAPKCKVLQLFTAPYAEYDSLVMDDEYGAELAARLLYDKGHRVVLYLGGDERAAGFKRIYQDIPLAHCFLDWSMDSSKIEQLLRKYHPTAILGVARQAEAAWTAVMQLGLRVPEDISFVAYDDINWVRMFGITAVAHPLEEIAETLTDMLLFHLGSANTDRSCETAPRQQVIRPILKERSSVADLRR